MLSYETMKAVLLDSYTDKINDCMIRLDQLDDKKSSIDIIDDDLIETQRQRIRNDMDKYSFYMKALDILTRRNVDEIKMIMDKYGIDIDDLKEDYDD